MNNEATALDILTVKCARCLTKHGQSTYLGELVRWPNGQWAWHRGSRRGRGVNRWVGKSGAPTFGGVETHCRRCGKQLRFTPARLATRRTEGNSIAV